MELRNGLLVIIALFVGYSECQLDDMVQIFKNDKKVYCGKNLATALSAICHGNYNTINKQAQSYQKRSSDNPYAGRRHARDITFPFKEKTEAFSMMSLHRGRRRRGVYNECCQKPCSKEELHTYCGTSPIRGRRRK